MQPLIPNPSFITSPTRVLVAALNWGLGHAARCMPIIDELLRQGAEVHIAADGRALYLLQQHYPQLPAYCLPSYNIQYASNPRYFEWTMAKQMPVILKAIRREYDYVQRLCQQYGFHLLISDHRYGCRSPHVPSIMVAHQIFILLPPVMRYLQPLLWRWHMHLLHKFDGCWIPDYAAAQYALSGLLAHARPLPTPFFRFIGALSRFADKATLPPVVQHDIVAVLSGPEPQRTQLEQILLEQALQNIPATMRRMLIVRGITEQQHEAQQGAISLVNSLPSTLLQAQMNAAQVIIARSGYSTLMDLAALRRPAILIPTPGQTEQEYLAENLATRRVFYAVEQSAFDLPKAVGKALSGEYTGLPTMLPNDLPLAIGEALQQAKKGK